MEKEQEQKDLFHEVEGFSILEAINEAKRCLRCKVPQCAKFAAKCRSVPRAALYRRTSLTGYMRFRRAISATP